MLHSGNIYEARARIARYQELRSLAKVLAGFLFRPVPSSTLSRTERFSRLDQRPARLDLSSSRPRPC